MEGQRHRNNPAGMRWRRKLRLSMHQLPPHFLPDPDATAALALRFAERAREGDVLLLSGPIGAGKSHFARAFIQCFVDEDVPSPTFTLVQTYQARAFEIWHADLYRLSHPDEADELGLIEAFETAVCLVEWPEKLGKDAPKKALTLLFSTENDGRQLRISFHDQNWYARLQGIIDG